MSGSGHNHSFNTILHNNRLLLKRRNIFRKSDSFLDSRRAYLKAAKGEINLRSATKEELAKLRSTVIRNRRKEMIRTWLISIFITIPILFLSIQIYSFFANRAISAETQKDKQEQIQKLENESQLEKRKAKEYVFLLSDGDNWLEKGNFRNAIHQYERAVELYPNKFDANLKLVQAHFLKCKKENDESCSEGTLILERMKRLFPDEEITVGNNGY